MSLFSALDFSEVARASDMNYLNTFLYLKLPETFRCFLLCECRICEKMRCTLEKCVHLIYK